MVNGEGRKSQNLRILTDSHRRIANSGVHAVLVLIVLIILVPAAMFSVSVAFLCVSAVVIAAMALIVGLGRTGGGFLILGFAAVPLNAIHPIGYLPFLELSDAFFITGFLLLVPRLAGTALRVPAAFLLGGVGFLAVGTLSALTGDQPGADFQRLLELAIGLVLFPILLVWWQPGRRNTIAAAAAYTFGNFISVVASPFQGAEGNGRYAGLATQPNVMGLCQLLSLALAPFLLRMLPRRYAWVICVGSVVSVYGIWISGSRAALLVTAALTLVYPLFRRSIPAALAVVALSLPAIVVVGRESQNPDPSNALGRLLGAGGASDSNDARAAGAQDAIHQFLSHPLLGDGWTTVFVGHNAYLQIAAAIGLFGLVFYLMMLAPLLRPLIVVPPPYGLLAVPALAAVMISVADPLVGSRYIWAVAVLALCADRLAALTEEPLGRASGSAVVPP